MVPEQAFSPAQDAFVAAYMAERKGREMDVERLVTSPCGLDPAQMMTVLSHPGLEGRGLEVLADYLRPENSMYFDAIFGANYGQKDIRGWLVPTMAAISFIEFVPQQESVVFGCGDRVGMIDEWKMVARLDGMELPLADGISVRRFEDGWITSVIDIYDTMSSRTPPPADAELPAGMPEPAPLPGYPEMNWPVVDSGDTPPLSAAAAGWVKTRLEAHGDGAHVECLDAVSGLGHDDLHAIHNHPELGLNFHLVADMMHPGECVYIDPIFGRFEGQSAIRGWMLDIMGKMGSIVFEPISDILWDGNTSLQMWKQVAVLPDGARVEMSWGASVRRFRDGWLVYCADYFDTFSLQKPEVQSAGQAAGSTITMEDILRYRPELQP